MTPSLRSHADTIVTQSIRAVLPDEAVRRALRDCSFPGRVVLVAAGKAAWQMASTAVSCLPGIGRGVVITKYGHVRGPIPGCTCFEGGHSVPDENGFLGTEAAIRLVSGLSAEDTVLFLLSGGGSALFERPLIPAGELQDITRQLLACSAGITEINTIRKRLSAVKGGRFARLCAPARVFSVVLSDVLGDPLDMIASGPVCPDRSTCEDARRIADKYGLTLSAQARACLDRETPKQLSRVETQVSGSVRELCAAAAASARGLGYEPFILTDMLCCQAREAGSFLASIARTHCGAAHPVALIAGGETVVRLTGKGLGGRNQEIALSAAAGIAGLKHVAVFSIGSDGTDGPTDAAGGYADGRTAQRLSGLGLSIDSVLADNDAYHALARVGGLIFTGPTGTNVNDVAVVLIHPQL